MALLFWRSNRTVSDAGDTGTPVVSEDTPLPVGIYHGGAQTEGGNPLPTKEVNEETFIKGRYFETDLQLVPGVGTGAAYADLDTFGTEISIPDVPEYWLLTQVDLLDPDDEGLLMRAWLGRETMGVSSADNAALAMPDTSLALLLGTPIAISSFGDANTGQIGTKANIDRWLHTPHGLYVHMQAGGAVNIAAGSIPSIRLKGLY